MTITNNQRRVLGNIAQGRQPVDESPRTTTSLLLRRLITATHSGYALTQLGRAELGRIESTTKEH